EVPAVGRLVGGSGSSSLPPTARGHAQPFSDGRRILGAGRNVMLFKTATSRNIFSIVAVGVVATVATASALFVMSYQDIKASSVAEMTAAATITAGQVERRISANMQMVYTMRDSMLALKTAGKADRAVADEMLAQVQRGAPGLLGVWTGWEKNAFDGRDAEYVGKPHRSEEHTSELQSR